MIVELVPVIELGYSNQGIPVPGQGPFWEYTKEWDDFHTACYSMAGFHDVFPAYLPGLSFCRLKDITGDNLVKLTMEHTEKMRNGDYSREQACAFFGGYVLRINSQDKYFPQCCGDLSDIQYWEKLFSDGEIFFYQGHPEPQVTITIDKIIFDFSVSDTDEYFSPPVADIIIELDRIDLYQAIDKVKTELKIFSQRLIAINIQEQLGISNIDKLLVWGD